ncbi:MAG: hypothetical protein J6Y11_04710 [Paludibacteraceae bacterium]|nr:hypothetical protein [Paludibacteraceae bacterium]
MAKKTTIAATATSTGPTVNKGNATNIKTLMGAIDAKITSGGTNLYDKNRDLIKSLFNPAIPYNVDVVYKRLVVIDSLYSTNMNQRYYGIEDMANTIDDLSYNAGIASDDNLRNRVRNFRDSLFLGNDIVVYLGNDIVDYRDPIAKAFAMSYGIHKNLNQAGSAMSLLSKYFYYLLLTDPSEKIGFPIYDSLASYMYPIVCKYVYASGTPREIVNVKTIDHLCNYFLALDQLRTKIDISSIRGRSLQEFDLLDAYLWRMGKFNGNNFSLLLDQGDYKNLINAAVHRATDMPSSAVIGALGAYRKSNGCPSLRANPLFANLWDHANDLGI